jgi:hypothetical protein
MDTNRFAPAIKNAVDWVFSTFRPDPQVHGPVALDAFAAAGAMYVIRAGAVFPDTSVGCNEAVEIQDRIRTAIERRTK